VLFLDEKKKKLIYFLGTLFVAIAFVSSYAAVGSFATTSTVTTTIAVPSKTYFVSGTANGVVSGYSSSAVLVLRNANLSSAASNALAALEGNGSISSYLSMNGSYQVLLSSMNAYSLQQDINRRLNSSNATYVNASTEIVLPSKVYLALGSQTVAVTLPQRNYSINVYPLMPLNATIRFNLNAIIAGNGTIYNNQLTLKQA
jgi:hypothetical protein